MKHDDLKHHDHDFEYPENYENVSPLSMSSPPTLSNFTVHYSGNTINPSRIYYLSAVVGSEALGYYQCKNYNMTDSQIKELYKAQAVAANTYLEYTAKVNPKHSGYTVCSISHCQTYDPTKITTFITNAVNEIMFNISSDYYCLLQLYTGGTSAYSYIYGAYFARCAGTTLAYPGSSQPALKAVSCTDIGGNTVLSGNGWGMCQYGAAYQASIGKSSLNILNKYYTNTASVYCKM